MENLTDTQIENLAEKAIIKIRNSGTLKVGLINEKNIDASDLAGELSGETLSGDDLNYFWNLVGASLSYVKPAKLIY